LALLTGLLHKPSIVPTHHRRPSTEQPDVEPNKDRDDPWGPSWQDEPDKPVVKLTRDQAQALIEREPMVSPWRVVVMQLGVGVVVALLAWGTTGRLESFWSALYGAAVVVVPAALMARGMTSKLSSANPIVGVLSFFVWLGVKLAVSVGMLMAAYRVVPSLSWPALIAGLVVCIKVYWVALLWRRAPK
jgi:ATP synthase protein I